VVAAGSGRGVIDRRDRMSRWEYATVPLISHALQQILNQWGGDGWELVAIADNVAYFKRPLDGEAA
jgi:hypothetical protein